MCSAEKMLSKLWIQTKRLPLQNWHGPNYNLKVKSREDDLALNFQQLLQCADARVQLILDRTNSRVAHDRKLYLR